MDKCLPQDVSEALVTRLETDDSFRELFQRSPRRALAELGYRPALDPSVGDDSEAAVWTCLHGEGLPGKDELRAMHERLTDQLSTNANQQIFQLSLR